MTAKRQQIVSKAAQGNDSSNLGARRVARWGTIRASPPWPQPFHPASRTYPLRALIEDTLTSATWSHQLRKIGIDPIVARDGERDRAVPTGSTRT